MEATQITVFTPTYNRASHLVRLYGSILQQQYDTFEWLIVDDGSTDDTRRVVEGFKEEGQVTIRYFFQQNSGKHIAINTGVKEASGELFFIVDSDDLLLDGALQEINKVWQTLRRACGGRGYAGICGLRRFENGEVIGGAVDYQVLDTSILDYRYNRKYKGDKAEVFVTEVLADYPFPTIEGEKFCTEGLVWNRIGLSYNMRFFNEPLYITEFLDGGLTSRSLQLRKENPQYAMLFYSELLNMPRVAFRYKLRAALNFWRFSVYDRQHSLWEKIRQVRQFWAVGLLPIGYGLYFLGSLRK